MSAHVPILPVTILGGNRVWPQGQKYPRFFRHVEVVFHPLIRLDEIPKDVHSDYHIEQLNSELRQTIKYAVHG